MGHADFGHLSPDRAVAASSRMPVPHEINEAPPAAIVSNGQETSLLGLARAVWRHRRAIVAVALVFMVGTGFYVATRTPLYTAEGAVVIASRKIMIPGVEAVSTPTGDIAIIRSEMGVLASRTLLRQVAAALHLDTNPEFNPLLRPKRDFFARLDPRPFLYRMLYRGPERNPDQGDYVAAAVETTLRENLALINNEKDYVITIRYRSEDPQTSATVVNTLVDKYLSQYAQIKANAAEEASTALTARADQLRDAADAADAAVADFVKNNRFVASRSGSIGAQQLEDLNLQLATARSDRAAAEARYRDALSMPSGGGTASNSEVLASPLIQTLRAQEAEASSKAAALTQNLGPNHPDVQAVQAQLAQIRSTIQTEIGKIIASLKGQADVARAREAGIETRFAQLKGSAVDGSTADAQLQQLKVAADAKRQIYAGFLAKIAESAQPGDRQPIDARMISAAVPPIDPSNQRGLVFIAIAGVIGALGAVAFCLTSEQLDRGFATLDQVRAATGLPAYAAIPPLRGRWRWALSGRHVVDYPNSVFAETLRGVRARLRWVGDHQKVLLVTSAQPGEGKTNFALALAQITALDGARTLLIEGDMRNPMIGTVLASARSAEPADVLSGKVAWQDRIGFDERSGLYYLVASGPSTSFPVLLEQPAQKGPIEQMKAAFDYVIIDSPPVLRVADATVLASFVDSVVLVVAAKRTRQRAIAEALRRLFTVGKPIGIVLTNTAEQPSEEDVYAGYKPRRRPRWAAFSSRSAG
jgi:succinoglycan biosynthesis transport protein ExoP